MKIAIYGDSYAHCIAPNLVINSDGARWSDIVKSAGFDVTNYAQSSSSFYYSYMKFKKNHRNYDKNIFLGTFPGRRYILHNGHEINALTWHTMPEFKNHSTFGGKIYDALCLYYGYLYNKEEDEEYLQLMEDYVLLKNNVLYLNIRKTLHRLNLKNKEYFGIQNHQHVNENMYCHMTNENNKVLADNIIKWILTGNFKFNIDDYPNPNMNTKEKYWPGTT